MERSVCSCPLDPPLLAPTHPTPVIADFTFYVSFAKDTGIKLFDIRYRGDRIVYELALQDAIAHYAGKWVVPRSIFGDEPADAFFLASASRSRVGPRISTATM